MDKHLFATTALRFERITKASPFRRGTWHDIHDTFMSCISVWDMYAIHFILLKYISKVKLSLYLCTRNQIWLQKELKLSNDNAPLPQMNSLSQMLPVSHDFSWKSTSPSPYQFRRKASATEEACQIIKNTFIMYSTLLWACLSMTASIQIRGFTWVLRRYPINSNSPSGGMKDIVRSFSNLDRRTHWWNFTSSSSTDLLFDPAIKRQRWWEIQQ